MEGRAWRRVVRDETQDRESAVRGGGAGQGAAGARTRGPKGSRPARKGGTLF